MTGAERAGEAIDELSGSIASGECAHAQGIPRTRRPTYVQLLQGENLGK